MPHPPQTESHWRTSLEKATPAGLKTFLHYPENPSTKPTVLLVHGSLDRGASFSRSLLRLTDTAVVSYDRRGYQGSRGMDLTGGFRSHLDDFFALAEAANQGHGVVAIGHSFGGDLVQAAALERPELLAALGAYEPPMPWIGFHRHSSGSWPPLASDPGDEAEQFFRRMVGDAAWDRLSDGLREDRRADGPALVVDLSAIRTLQFDPKLLTMPSHFGSGTTKTAPHHRDTVEWLGANVRGAQVTWFDDSGHGAHLTHPDAFARFIEQVRDSAPHA